MVIGGAVDWMVGIGVNSWLGVVAGKVAVPRGMVVLDGTAVQLAWGVLVTVKVTCANAVAV